MVQMLGSTSEIKSHLGPQYLISLSRIIVLDPSDARVQEFTKEYHVERGFAEVEDIEPLDHFNN